jgi:hypothetical protein
MASWAAGPSACSDPLIAHRKIRNLQYTKQSLSTLIAAGLFSLTIPSALVAELAGAVQVRTVDCRIAHNNLRCGHRRTAQLAQGQP